MEKALILLSGGMDSATALAAAIKDGYEEVKTISFNYGSKHNNREFEYAEKLANHYKVSNTRIDITFINDVFKSDLLLSGGEIPEGHYAHESMIRTVVPFRNGIMLAIAAGFAESNGLTHIVLSNHTGDHAIYPDCRRQFTDAMGMAIAQGTYNGIELVNPFGCLNKTEIAKMGSQLEVPYELTWSCYKGGEIHCGKCGTCVERKEAFRDALLKEDPTIYEA